MNSIKLSAAALTITGSAFADFTSASFTVEEAVAGYDTYKIFLNFSSPADKLLAVNGDVDGGYSALAYNGGDLYNDRISFGPLTITDDIGELALPGDSWVTIGGQSDDVSFSPGFLADNANEFGELISGSSFTWANNGGYFDSNPGTGAYDSDGSGILIAQLTVASGEDITFGGTASYNSEAGELSAASFSVTTVPAPGALALLGLAGLGRRRRG